MNRIMVEKMELANKDIKMAIWPVIVFKGKAQSFLLN